MKNQLLLRLVSGIICAYCIILGICLNGGEAVVSKLALQFLEYEIPAGSPLVFAAAMTGAYMGFFGLCMGLVAWRPVQHRALLSVAVALLLFRALQRILNFQTLQETFGLSSGKNTAYVLTVVGLAVLLLFFRIRLFREMTSSASS